MQLQQQLVNGNQHLTPQPEQYQGQSVWTGHFALIVVKVLEDDPGECPHCLLLLNSNSKFEALSMLIFCWSIGGLGFLLAVPTTQMLLNCMIWGTLVTSSEGRRREANLRYEAH
ncbi:Protein SMG7 [Prunus yedoensis var. nudiflora]|uniref:Protein SMG7 n=1 Tax=Prunus yedoensis var. nudiflora TaxID=2094558 RepID=A0A314Z2S4_PRUYE|nr:Protein SMG7 [Prunus yedoensis var. nudiflora]